MATARTLPLNFLAGLGLLCAASGLQASGGWFDAAPATSLADDLDRLPAKTLGDILLETVEPGKFEIAQIVEKDAVGDDEIKAVIAQIGKEKPEALAAEIDKLVMTARLKYVAFGGVLNELYDIRDAITSKGPSDEERKQYCNARLGLTLKVQPDIVPDTYAMGEPMRAHLLYLQGAALFTGGLREEARPWFEAIVRKMPDHPRAETAAFLVARCALSKARSYEDAGDDKKVERRQKWDEATKVFREFIKKYPQGRYVADAHGWLGALLWQDHPAEALEEYIAQLEDPAHPECRKSAAHMVERVLAKVVGHPDENEAILKVVAQHPRIAQAAVYLVLNAPEIDPFDGKYDETADLKKWKQAVLPKLAGLVSAEEKRYTGEWTPRLRAMLAQAASNAGNQEQALKLTDATEAELKASDDLLFARIVVLQRMKQPKEVAKAGKLFFESFPESPLIVGVSLRLAQALVDEHRAGEAYVYLFKSAQANESSRSDGDDGIYPPAESEMLLSQSALYSGVDGGNAFTALKSTILDFAPIKELEAVMKDKVWEEKPDALAALTDALRIRKAALEDYAGAMELGGDEPFKQRMETFAKLAKAVKNASGKAKAQAMMALGDAYEEAFNEESRARGDDSSGNDALSKRESARALGMADPDEELENSNLMRHATRWWLRAARTVPGTEVSAKARSKILEGMERIARNSDYDFTRAMEANLAKVSRDIYDILQKESPKSTEAHNAVYWDFTPCPKPKPKEKKEGEPELDSDYQPAWRVRGEEDPGREEDALSLMGGYHALHYNAFGKFPLANGSSWEPEPPPAEGKEPEKLPSSPADLEALSPARLAKFLEEARKNASSPAEVSDVNFLTDIAQLNQIPNLNHRSRFAYIKFRMSVDAAAHGGNSSPPAPKLSEVLKEARAAAALEPVQDFVDYAEIYGMQADRGTGYEDFHYPDYAAIEAACRAFLAKHPKSLKRQACSLVLIRSIFRQLPDRFGHKEPGERHEHKMDDQRPVEELDEPFRPAALVKAIANYEKEFPMGRYAAEIRNYQGIVAWRKFEYGDALELTIAQLADERHPDLRMEAAVRLANIFADLRDAKHRGAVLAALKTRPAAVAKLKLYLDVAPQNSDHALRCMRKYLGDQLGFE